MGRKQHKAWAASAFVLGSLLWGCAPASDPKTPPEATSAQPSSYNWSVIDAYRPTGAATSPKALDARFEALVDAFLHEAQPKDDAAREMVRRVDALSPLGDLDAALPEIDALLAELDTRYDPDAALRASLLHHQVWTLAELGRLDDANAAQAEAERIAAATTGPAARLVRAQVAGAQAFILSKGDDMAAAADALRAAHEMLDDPEGFEAFEHANLLRGTATLDYFAGRQVQSVETGRRGVALLDASVDPRRPNQIDRHVGAVSTLAALEGVTGEADAAFANQEKAMRLAAAYLPERSHTVSTLQHNYAHGLTRRGRHREAEAVYRSALNRTVETLGPDHPDVGITLGKLGETQMRQGRHDAALRTLDQALRVVRDKAIPMNVAYAAADAGEAAMMTGAFDAAETYFREAVSLLEDGDAEGADAHAPAAGVTQLYYADLLSRLGRHGEAAVQAEAGAARILPALPETSSEGRMARAQTVLARSMTDPAGAHAQARPLADELDLALRSGRFEDEGWSRASAALRRPLALLSQVAVRAGDAEESFRLLQLATLSDMGEWEQRRRLAATQADPAQRDRLETLRRTREALMQADTALQQAIASEDAAAAELKRRDIRGLRGTLADVLDSKDASLRLRSLASVQAALQPDEAVLFVITDPRPSAVLVRADSVQLRASELFGSELQRAADGLRRSVLRGEATAPTEDADTLGWMFEAGDLSGVDTLHVLGTDAYGRFPMHLLPDPAAPDRWLGERVALNHLSGLEALFGAPDAGAARPAAARYLAVGDAAFAGPGADMQDTAVPATNPMERRRDAMRALSPLPETRREVTDIAAGFDGPQTLLLGQAATEAAFRDADPQSAGLIVLATHGLMAGDLPGLSEPALAFTPPAGTDGALEASDDGLLTAFEVSDLVLSADLVILSACNTASSDAGDQPLSGLPRAFVSAGAKSVMVSHWPVRDDAAAHLSQATFRARQEGATAPQALRTAMADLRASGLDGAEDPGVWGAFVIVGR